MLSLLLGSVFGVSAARADTLMVAVASNFTTTAQQLATQFEAATGHALTLSSASTGKLVAQIQRGAPFEVFLSADAAGPAALVKSGHAVPNSAFTYALGRLVLWSAQPGRVDPQGRVLHQGDYRRLALADPKLAPYGAAALEWLSAQGLWPALQPKALMAENITQTFQWVATGHAELGLVARAQWLAWQASQPQAKWGSAWEVPSQAHQPLQQDAVLLQAGQGRAAAQAFLSFLKTPAARQIIARAGYDLP